MTPDEQAEADESVRLIELLIGSRDTARAERDALAERLAAVEGLPERWEATSDQYAQYAEDAVTLPGVLALRQCSRTLRDCATEVRAAASRPTGEAEPTRCQGCGNGLQDAEECRLSRLCLTCLWGKPVSAAVPPSPEQEAP